VNLVNNAVKFTPSGGEVRVIVRRLNESIEFKVQDTGIGIPQEDLPYIFDRFYRVEHNRARRHNSGGSGLGLTISKQVVEMHGGKIMVASSGKGTTFTFTISQKAKVAVAQAS
ncbi:MAG: sensor histidine kinase, partial [Candidatus Sericytochromatia bacterium]